MTPWHAKEEFQGFCCPDSLHAFLETKHFHSSFGPRAIFLLERWKIPLTDGKKNNFSWTNSETKFLLKLKKDRGIRESKFFVFVFNKIHNFSSGFLFIGSCLRIPNWLVRGWVTKVIGGAGWSWACSRKKPKLTGVPCLAKTVRSCTQHTLGWEGDIFSGGSLPHSDEPLCRDGIIESLRSYLLLIFKMNYCFGH